MQQTVCSTFCSLTNTCLFRIQDMVPGVSYSFFLSHTSKICIMVCMVVGKMRNAFFLAQNVQFVCTTAYDSSFCLSFYLLSCCAETLDITFACSLLDEAEKRIAENDQKQIVEKSMPSPASFSPATLSSTQVRALVFQTCYGDDDYFTFTTWCNVMVHFCILALFSWGVALLSDFATGPRCCPSCSFAD